jgi:riboflavin transporter FmnP
MNTRFTSKYMARVAVLGAIASVLFFFPEVPIFYFYKLDFSMLPALLGGFALGPVAGLLVTLIKDLTGLLHSSSAGVGELADFLISAAFVVTASVIYARRRTHRAAVMGMLAGLVAMIVAGIALNLWVLIPLYMSPEALQGFLSTTPFSSALEFVLLVAGPFNLIKGLAIGIPTYYLYMPLRPLLKGRE